MRILFLESLPYRSEFRVGSHHYASRFAAAGWEVMWISHPLSLLHLVHPVKREIEERMLGWRQGPLMREGVLYYSPMTLAPASAAPVLRWSVVTRSSAAWTVPSLESVIRKAGFSRPDVAWLTNPVFEPVASRLQPRCRVVRVADAHREFAQVPPAMQRLEDAAIRQADVVFAVSRAEADRLRDQARRVVRLPNGAEYESFATPAKEPAEIASVPHPRVAYVGALEYWFDADALAAAARSMPEAAFLVIGPVRADLGEMVRLPNVHLLGARPYDSLPGYLQHSDAAVVPFKRDAMVDSIHPIKVYEYLAAGLPVIATPWRELEAMRAPVRLAPPEGLAEAIREELASPSTSAEERRSYARENSWDERFRRVLETIDPVLEAAGGCE